jgi:5-methyltetrahydrofolate--homocysteine methyltransferase
LSKEEALKQLADVVVKGDEPGAKKAAEEAIGMGVDPLEAINGGVVAGLEIVGKKFESKEYMLPDLVCSADAAQVALGVIRPLLRKDSVKTCGRVVVGTVEGDLHDIGKNLVVAMLEAYGFEVIDLGTDVPAKKFIEAVKKYNAHILGASATLSGGTKMEQKVIAKDLAASGIRDKTGYMVGGSVTDQSWAESIGADAHGEDCVEAAQKALEVLERFKRKRGET